MASGRTATRRSTCPTTTICAGSIMTAWNNPFGARTLPAKRAKQTVAGAAQKKLRQINDRRARNLEIMPQTRLRRSRCAALGTRAVLLAIAHLGFYHPVVERAV
jgi:hypothetical protein